jgi:hypothetical protein
LNFLPSELVGEYFIFAVGVDLNDGPQDTGCGDQAALGIERAPSGSTDFQHRLHAPIG